MAKTYDIVLNTICNLSIYTSCIDHPDLIVSNSLWTIPLVLKGLPLIFQPVYDKDIGGPKHKIPWIEYNDTVMADSQLIINFLNEKFGVDLNKHLSSEERATAWAIQKWLEEYTYWYA